MNRRSTRNIRCIMRGELTYVFQTGTKTKSVFWDDLLSRLALTGFCTKALDQISTRATVNTLNLFHESFGMLTFSFIADYVALRL